MSSIYKKGMDGYYYYQTYVYNPESKKKDKRVFHALGTKNSIEAAEKQHALDLTYDKQKNIDSNPIGPSYNFKLFPIIAIIVGTIIITVFLNDYFRSDKVKANTNSQIIFDKAGAIKGENDAILKVIEPVKSVINEQGTFKVENIPETLKSSTKQKLAEPKVVLPKYTVERVERLSGAFEQGKVYVTIDGNSSNESQQLLCKDLAKRFSEFSNIIICLYSKNRAGVDIAKGNDKTVSIKEKRQSWLAMYTYNPVEGEYFDDKPSSYLGTY